MVSIPAGQHLELLNIDTYIILKDGGEFSMCFTIDRHHGSPNSMQQMEQNGTNSFTVHRTGCTVNPNGTNWNKLA
jgi:hypothetical protein